MESVNDIIKEMRNRKSVLAVRNRGSEGAFASFEAVETDAFRDLADRIEAAYKRDLQSIVDAGEIDMRTAMDEVTRLRSALKPVLQCPVCDDFSPIQQAKYTMRAVADAIHVYTGGAK